MIPYLLHVALLISVCLLFYKLLLQRETFYRLNRVVLVFCLALAFVLPLIPIPQQWALRSSAKPAEVSIQPQNVRQSVNVIVPQNDAPTIPAVVKPQNKQANLKATTPPSTIKQSLSVANQDVSLMQRMFKWLFYLYW